MTLATALCGWCKRSTLIGFFDVSSFSAQRDSRRYLTLATALGGWCERPTLIGLLDVSAVFGAARQSPLSWGVGIMLEDNHFVDALRQSDPRSAA
jgi:hypothetical protein